MQILVVSTASFSPCDEPKAMNNIATVATSLELTQVTHDLGFCLGS